MSLHKVPTSEKPIEYDTDILFDFEFVWRNLQHFTVGRVAWYLQFVFDCADEELYLVSGEKTSPMELAGVDSAILASRVELWFKGGPPNLYGWWYEGTLLHLLIDRFWHAIAMRRYDTVDLFMETVKSNRRR